jgi:hypothetical protein
MKRTMQIVNILVNFAIPPFNRLVATEPVEKLILKSWIEPTLPR